METNKVDILSGPSKEEAAEIYRTGNKENVRFETNYGCKRTMFVDILEIVSVQETSVKMLATVPAGFFMYSQGEDPKPNSEKLHRIQVHVFYTTNTGKGYIEKITKEKAEEPRECPRCRGRKVDPYYYQDDCHRCGGVGKVSGPESSFSPGYFVD